MKILETNFVGIKDHLRKDFDWVHINIGYEGMGKSTLAWKICKIIDPNFSVKNIVFTFDELMLAMDKAKPYTAIMIDEGAEIFFNLNTTTREGRIVARKFMACRSKNIFYVINIPDFSSLQRYIKTHRISSLTRVVKRGKCEFFSRKRCSRIKMGKDKQLYFPVPNFYAEYGAVEDEEWKQYIRKKEGFQKRETSRKVIREKMKRMKKLRNTYTITEIGEIFNVNKATVRMWVNHGMGGKMVFRKKSVFKDINGFIRIKSNEMKMAEKRIKKYKNK